ncbi:venom prothrombin activator oscutarin-C catalytic subunit-like isoform X1 [Scyliorhinus canicula]|uniref:venom prothrombin activator oscutarin-C catalytic subunit-like isoform X1 n=1 Tax=Scyliorhinus canicula TaxID=7830 RepID=UPI0018F5A7F9|nr:venom prothrombin activator oscutarin-C catalytic subunit-like isoform X1 [Scyliorhinus canicula]
MINLNMTIILSCGIISLLLFECHANDLFLQKPEAVRFLSRFRRANSFREEWYAGNMERECVEETCSEEEAREIFENDVQTDFFWSTYSNGNLSSLITTVKVIEEEQRVIDNIEKKLMEIEMKIKTCEISLFTMLKDCINGK